MGGGGAAGGGIEGKGDGGSGRGGEGPGDGGGGEGGGGEGAGTTAAAITGTAGVAVTGIPMKVLLDDSVEIALDILVVTESATVRSGVRMVAETVIELAEIESMMSSAVTPFPAAAARFALYWLCAAVSKSSIVTARTATTVTVATVFAPGGIGGGGAAGYGDIGAGDAGGGGGILVELYLLWIFCRIWLEVWPFGPV